MGSLVGGDLIEDLFDGCILERNLAPTFDIGVDQATARDTSRVVFGFEVLEIQREVENVFFGHIPEQ